LTEIPRLFRYHVQINVHITSAKRVFVYTLIQHNQSTSIYNTFRNYTPVISAV